MNAASISTPDIIILTENEGDSDSDSSSDGIPDYYLPLSSDDADLQDNHPTLNLTPLSNALNYPPPAAAAAAAALQNGHDYPPGEDVEEEDDGDDDDDDDDDDEMRRISEADAAIRRAFLQDDSRRNAPLPSHDAARVIQAMRSVSLTALPPDWANNLVDDRWLDHLQRLRHPPTSLGN